MPNGPDMSTLELFQRLGVALAIGFLVGVERGWRERDEVEGARTAGVRTFALYGLFGGVTGLLALRFGGVVVAGLAPPFALVVAAFSWREAVRDQAYSVTGVIAGLVVFALGVYAVAGQPGVAAAAGVAMVGLLALRTELHAWLKRLTWPELRSAVVLLAMTAIALPLLPDRGLGPYQAINPYALWLITIVLASLSFLAYVAVRVLGPKRGGLAATVVGALVSSTAVTLEAARQARNAPASALFLAGGATLASVVMALRIVAVAGALSWPLAQALLVPLGAFALLSLAAGALLVWRGQSRLDVTQSTLRSPLDLGEVFRFAVLLGGLLVLSTLVRGLYGEGGLLPMAALSGLADVDAMTLSAAKLVQGGLPADQGQHVVLAAAATNMVSKTVLGALAGGRRFAVVFGATSAAGIAAAATALLFF